MTDKSHMRRNAVAAAVLLLVTGGLLGMLVTRLWLVPAQAEARPLTVEAMVQDLGLSRPDEARVRALLDSMHPIVMAAAQVGPDSMLAAARGVHRRLEEILPADARPRLGGWMAEHHRQMMERLQFDNSGGIR